MKEFLIEPLLEELIIGQQKTLLILGQRFVPNLTDDDILQPNDFRELEENPHFRYEEGVLAGLLTAQAAMRAAISQSEGKYLPQEPKSQERFPE